MPRRYLPLSLLLLPLVQSLALAASIVTHDVSFVVPGAKLYGTMTLPGRPAGLAPAVLLLPGPGARSRLEERESAPVQLHAELAAALAAQGIASLRYDQRGQGRSISLAGSLAGPLAGSLSRPLDEDDAGAGLSRLTADAAVALAFLRDQPGVSPGCAALLGHSEGALAAAALAAAAPEGVRGLVLLSSPGRKGHEIMDQARRDALVRSGAPPSQIEQVERLQARLYQAARTGSWDGIPPEVRARADTPWFREIIDVDPLATLRRVRAHALPVLPVLPVLIVHGEADAVLPPRYGDAERSAQALREGRMASGEPGGVGPVKLVWIQGADHHLRLGAGAEAAPEALGAISAFLREVFTLPLPRPACWRR